MLEISAPALSDLIRHPYFRYPKFLPRGTLFIEVNTSFFLTICLQLLASQRPLFPHIFDCPTIVERLNTAVEDLTIPALSRLLAFVPVHSEDLEFTGSDDIHHETRLAEESSKDVHSEDGYCDGQNRKTGYSESEQSEYEDLQSDEDYYGDYYESNDSEHRAWASVTEVLIPHTEDDGDFVLAALSGNIFTSITREEDGYLIGNLEVPGIKSRLGQTSPNAKVSTVHEGARTNLDSIRVSCAMEARIRRLAAQGIFTRPSI